MGQFNRFKMMAIIIVELRTHIRAIICFGKLNIGFITVNNYKLTTTGNIMKICFNQVSGLAAWCPRSTIQ